jgi:uncharacterized glyoxalase superfamily protein PhnB
MSADVRADCLDRTNSSAYCSHISSTETVDQLGRATAAHDINEGISMQVRSSTISLTVANVAESVSFFTKHLGYRQQMAAEGFASLSRDDEAVDVVFLQQGIEVLPEDQRNQHASGLILALAVADLDAELTRLQGEGVDITLPLQEEEWGERLFQIQDPNGVVVELLEWTEATGPSAWNENG